MDKRASLRWSVLLPGARRADQRRCARSRDPHTPKNKTDHQRRRARLDSALSRARRRRSSWCCRSRGTSRRPFEQFSYYEWIPSGIGAVGKPIANFSIDFAFRVDPLSCTMLMIVTWIGFLIHVYATGYMSHEKGYTRFFTYLNLFMFMMLLLVLGANYIVMFVGLGRRRALLVPADRLLLRQELRRRRGQEGVHHQPHRRLRLHPRHLPDLQHLRQRGLRQGLRAWRRTGGHGAVRRRSPRRSACCCSSARAASRRRFRCTSGCRTRWPARRRSPR